MLVLILPMLLPCAAAPPQEICGETMGTTYRVQVRTAPEGLDHLAQEVAAFLGTLDRLLSTYVEDSDVVCFNRWRSREWFAVAPDTAAVVSTALAVGEATTGAFDVTVAPLVGLWGFGAEARRGQGLPAAAEVEAARARVGLALLEVRSEPPALRKRREDVAIDLSGIAKGFALDRLATRLEARGLTSFLLELGGELYGKGTREGGEPWRVEVADPGSPGRGTGIVVHLDGRAVATSGDSHQSYVLGGRRYSHVVDPRSGWPVPDSLASVTVLDSSAARADALATALLVLGREEGLAFARREKLAVLFLVREGAAFSREWTPEFEAVRCQDTGSPARAETVE